jgi:sialate O-acetylesterase
MSVEFGPPFGEGMVLQRAVDGLSARLWGTGEPGRRFILAVAGRRAEVTVRADGRWSADLDLAAGGPHTLTVDGQPRFGRVWAGDVWFCGGQSNMERSVVQGAPWPVVSDRGDAAIRQLCVSAACDFTAPRDALATRWIGADSELGAFSSLGYAFAVRLWERTGVPQGLVLAAVGGSSAQAWLSARTLRRFGRHAARARWLGEDGNLNALLLSEAQRRDAFYQALEADPKDTRAAGSGDWQPVTLPSLEPTPFAGRVGTVWLRRRFSLPTAFEGPARLSLGTLVEADDAWVNGVWVGGTGYQYPSRRYPVPAGTLRTENELLIRLVVPRGGGRITPGKPLRLWGGPEAELSGPWEWRPGADAPYLPEDTFLPKEPLGLFNGVLSPLAGFSVRAVLWYQGESNTEDPSDYEALLKAVVGEFRRLWKRRLPFVAVQLPLFGPPSPADGWAAARDAQRRVLELPRTALVVALDQGEWNELHPADKDEIGRRLALAIRRLVLGDGVAWSGPLVRRCRRLKARLVVSFDHAEGLATADGRQPGLFRVHDGEAVRPVEARIEGDAVILDYAGSARFVDYGWADNPVANLVNGSGLPASPFRVSVR